MNHQQCEHHGHRQPHGTSLRESGMPELNLSVDEFVYTTDADLWGIYLGSFEDPAERQYHNCRACESFIRHFGGLAYIDPKTGLLSSALWRGKYPAKTAYDVAFTRMRRAVEKARVTGVFMDVDGVLGTPEKGGWNHFFVQNPHPYDEKRTVLTAGQAMAAKIEDFRTVSRALASFSYQKLSMAVELLSGDALYRSEKVLGQAKWLRDLKRDTGNIAGDRKRNIIWAAVAEAPAGFCHPRSGMIGSLLEDLEAGYPLETVAERFKVKMDPLAYQRPQAAPKSGAIEAAEKLVEKLGIQRSFERRYATLDDIGTVMWTLNEHHGDSGGSVFGHLKDGSEAYPGAINAGKITWVKFAQTVLNKAERIQVYVPRGLAAFTVFTTAQDPEAPYIFQWDSPVAWYQWVRGALATQYGLEAASWVDATAVAMPPFCCEFEAWDGDEAFKHFKSNAYFVLKGARETVNRGNAIFPETLKGSLHGVRSVVEAHSRKTKIHEIDGAHVVGLGIQVLVRVHAAGIVTEYQIDRWD